METCLEEIDESENGGSSTSRSGVKGWAILQKLCDHAWSIVRSARNSIDIFDERRESWWNE